MRALFVTLTLAAASIAVAGPSATAESQTPAFASISLTELKPLVEKKAVVLIDANGAESFAGAHIPGAINFAAHTADLATQLPADKNALIVAYCGGPRCGAWKDAATAAATLGYTNIKHFPDGISGWTAAKAPVEPKPAAQ